MEYYSPAPLPTPIFKLLSGDEYDKQGDWSVTELGLPPQIAILQRRYRKSLKINVMDMAFAVRGNIMHSALANVKMAGAIVEERFMINILGKQISMKADYVWPYQEAEGDSPRRFQIIDMKDPSRYKAQPDPQGHWYTQNEWTAQCSDEGWIKQVNCYAYGMRQRGFMVDDLVIAAFLRDWSWRECHITKVRDYPPHEMVIQPVPLWGDDQCLNYLESRVRLMEESLLLKDEELPECSNEDRWAKPDLWAAVTTTGATTRAVTGGSKFEDPMSANTFNDTRNAKKPKKLSTVEFRAAESIRCERGYCSAAAFCGQYKNKIKKNPF